MNIGRINKLCIEHLDFTNRRADLKQYHDIDLDESLDVVLKQIEWKITHEVCRSLNDQGIDIVAQLKARYGNPSD